MKINGRRILLTGASRGIGLAIAREAARRKASLHLVARSFPPDFARPLLDAGAVAVELVEADLSVGKEVERLANHFLAPGSEIDVLVNNAGLLTGGLLEEQKPTDITSMLNVNVHAVLLLSRLLLPRMLERRNGLIVNNASVTGRMYFPCASTYAASKAAVIAFTEALKQELRGTGVSTLLLVTPGVQTEMYDDIEKLYGGHLDISFMSAIPAQKWATLVCDAIEDGRDTLLPKGATGFGVALARHWPAAFESIIRTRFSRGPSRSDVKS